MSSKVMGTYGNILGTKLGISSCSNKTAVILTWIKHLCAGEWMVKPELGFLH
jgi:hypothetical protein